MIEMIEPVWLAFGSGVCVGAVGMLSFLCIFFVCGRSDDCQECPYLLPESEGHDAGNPVQDL
jgi:hypothetical protein